MENRRWAEYDEGGGGHFIRRGRGGIYHHYVAEKTLNQLTMSWNWEGILCRCHYGPLGPTVRHMCDKALGYGEHVEGFMRYG
jgi:hypothetical protein